MIASMALLDFLDFSKASRHRREMIDHAKKAVAKSRDQAIEAEKGLRDALKRTDRSLRAVGLADGLAWHPPKKRDDASSD